MNIFELITLNICNHLYKRYLMIGHFEGLADNLANCAKEGEQNTRGKVGEEYEDIVTARFLQSFSDAVENYGRKNPYNVEISTHKLPDSGKESAESRFGADYLIGFDMQLSNFELSNAIMVQAKRSDVDRFPSMTEIREQCERMLRWSPDSFLNILSNRSYRMYPAIQPAKSDGDTPTYNGEELDFDEAFDYRTTLKLYRLFFKGYVGDNWIYNNIDFLTNPKNNQPNNRPYFPDGGQVDDEGGMKALVITVTEPGVNPELPFDPDREVDEFAKGDSGLFDI